MDKIIVEQVGKAALPHGQQLFAMINHVGIGGIAHRTGLAPGIDDFLRHRQQFADTAINSAVEFALGLQVAGLLPSDFYTERDHP